MSPYYRGYFELHFGQEEVNASYFGMLTIINRNSLEISLANFTVKKGENALDRGAGLVGVEKEVSKFGRTVMKNATNDTETGVWSVAMDNEEDI